MSSAGDNQNLIGVFTTDERFIVQVWDAALEQMTGIAASAARGKAIVETIPDLEQRGLLRRFERVLAEGTVEILAPAFHRYLIKCAPPSAGHFSEMRQRVTIAPLRKNEQILGLIVSIEDVTARMEQEIEFARQLENADDTVRLQAAKKLSHEPENFGEENAAPLIEALGDKNWRVRRELVESLARRAAPDAIAALLRAMQEKHFDFSVLNSALQVLQATSVKTSETLIEFLRGDDADLRMQAALTLGEQKDAQATPALLEALGDENTNVRYHAIEALGKLRAAEAVEPLLAIAETRDFFLSFAALDALREIADEASAKRILPLLGDEDFLRDAVVETLGAVSGAEVVAPLVRLLNDEPPAAATVARALDVLFDRFDGDAGDGGAPVIERARAEITEHGKANLLAALHTANEADLLPLVRLGGWFEDKRIAERLAELLEDEKFRLEAMRSLVRHGASAVDLLIEGLEDEDSETRPTKALALGQIGDARAFEPLVALLRGDNPLFRLAAVEALKALAHPETVERLCGLLNEENAAVREKAIVVIGHLGAKGCADEIFSCCTDADERIRRAAIEQLPNIPDARSVPALIRALKEDSSRVRETAAKALARIKSDESVAALREALGDAEPWTRYFAVRALGALQDSASRAALAEMARGDAAEQVREAAREVLGELND